MILALALSVSDFPRVLWTMVNPTLSGLYSAMAADLRRITTTFLQLLVSRALRLRYTSAEEYGSAVRGRTISCPGIWYQGMVLLAACWTLFWQIPVSTVTSTFCENAQIWHLHLCIAVIRSAIWKGDLFVWIDFVCRHGFWVHDYPECTGTLPVLCSGGKRVRGALNLRAGGVYISRRPVIPLLLRRDRDGRRQL